MRQRLAGGSFSNAGLQASDGRVYLAGGTENISTAPYLLFKARSGYRYGNGELVDAAINDGLTDPFNKCAMGATAKTSLLLEDTHEDQDAFAAESQRRASEATDRGAFAAEIIPVEVPARKGPMTVTKDEHIRPGTTVETLAKLRPGFSA